MPSRAELATIDGRRWLGISSPEPARRRPMSTQRRLPDDETFTRLVLEENVPTVEIAARYGVSGAAVGQLVHRLGLVRPPRAAKSTPWTQLLDRIDELEGRIAALETRPTPTVRFVEIDRRRIADGGRHAKAQRRAMGVA